MDEAAYGAAIIRHYSAAGYGPAASARSEPPGYPRDLWEELFSNAPGGGSGGALSPRPVPE